MSHGNSIPKPVIVLAADGTGDPAGQRTLESIGKLLKERFPDCEVRWAIMGQYLINALRKAGKDTMFEGKVPMLNLAEVFSELVREGKTNVAVQCLMVQESSFSRLVFDTPTEGLNVKYAKPFLSESGNIERLVTALAPKFGDADTATILVGHGVFKNFEYNDCFIAMDEYVRKNYKNVFLTTLHGPPGTERAFADTKNSGCSQVLFISLMLTKGGHINSDVMGDTPESWRNQLGLLARVEDNLGETPLVTEFFLNSLGTLLSQF